MGWNTARQAARRVHPTVRRELLCKIHSKENVFLPFLQKVLYIFSECVIMIKNADGETAGAVQEQTICYTENLVF